ncbi:hypothetical protein [Serinicoccus sp. LYQ131]|uniref:hypothetical protein n=1 Tax=Serinicoccus sp. LYQ131 TaxID=3378797 RepID=UPI0038543FA8
MIQQPIRHRRACWVVRGAGRGGAPGLRRSRYARITLREAEGLLLGPEGADITEVHGAAPTAHPLSGLEDCTGQWVGLLADERDATWVAMTDFHGFGHLFYYLHRHADGQDVYLGTTLDVLVDRLRSDGITLSVNWAYTATTLASTHTLMRNHWAEETLVAGVSCLKPDQLLVISGTGVGTVPRPMTADPQGRSSAELLEAGIARSTSLLQQMGGAFDDLRVFASGGRDTRVVLALLAEAGVLPRVSFASADPVRWAEPAARPGLWRDLVVADELRRELGLPWSVEPEHEDRMMGLEESIAHHQSFSAGSQWAFAAERQLRWPVRPYVAVRGGAGEVMRTAYSAIRRSTPWQVMTDTPGTLRPDINRLHKMVVHPEARLGADLRDAGREAFSRAFSSPVPGAAIGEQLDGHYRLHRNRVHFGHVLHSLHRRSPAFYPLAMPEFLRAAQLTPFEQRDLGTTAFDVIERLQPRLNRHRFADGTWPAALWQQRDPTFTERPEPPQGPFGPDDLPDYFAQEEVNHGRRGHRSGAHRFEIRGATQTEAVRLLWRTHDLAPDDLPADLTARLGELVGLGGINAASTLVRLRSVLRAIDSPVTDTPPAALEIRLPSGPRGRGPLAVLRRREAAPREVVRTGPGGSVRSLADIVDLRPSAGLETFDADPATPPAVFCHAALTDGRLVAQRVGGERAGWTFDHTFTLLRGSTVVAEESTGQEPHVVLATAPKPGRYRVRLTASCVTRPEVTFRPLSMPVEVPRPD